MPFHERRILAGDGLALYARDYEPQRTERAVVLCLAGMTRNSKDFDHLASVLAAQRRVICPDYRGRGRSDYDPDWRHYEPLTYLSDILHLLAALDVSKAVVIGTSLGGLLAMGLAVARPGLLAGVVLNDIGPQLAVGGVKQVLDYVGKDRPQPTWEAACAEMQSKFGYLELGDPESWLRMTRATYREDSDGLLHFDWDVRLARAMRRTLHLQDELWTYFGALQPVPTLALRGAKSSVFPAEALDAMRKVKPDLMTVTVPDVGHTPNLSEPVAAAALEAFLADLP